MKATPLLPPIPSGNPAPPTKLIQNSKVWLLGIAAGLILLHLNLVWRTGNTDLLSTSVLFWGAILTLLWKKRDTLSLESGVFASFFGSTLIALVSLKSISLPSGNFIFISPLISVLGLGLLASGVRGLKQYWQEMLILLFIGLPHMLLSSLIDLSTLTAKFATFILLHLGFEVFYQGTNINLSRGGVEVYPGCSGLEPITQLLGLSVLFLVMFPLDWLKRILVPVVAMFVAFIVNGVRVALMAILVADSNQEAFEYWHTGNGSLIFSLISLMLFGLFCLFLLQLDKPETQNYREF
jgi:cyanoexosortase A